MHTFTRVFGNICNKFRHFAKSFMSGAAITTSGTPAAVANTQTVVLPAKMRRYVGSQDQDGSKKNKFAQLETADCGTLNNHANF
jgi:hypothetical protein